MENADKSGKNAPEHAPVDGYLSEDAIETAEDYNKDLKKRLEEKRNEQLIKYEELINHAPDFAIWLKSIIRYGNVDSQVLIFRKIPLIPETLDIEKEHFRCIFYTDTHRYSISGYRPTTTHPKGYLGCVASTRKPRPGEDWSRGNDLPDGDYSKKTFDKIVRGIIGYELKSLQLWRK